MGIKDLAANLKNSENDNSKKVEKQVIKTEKHTKNEDVKIPKFFVELREEIKQTPIDKKVITYIDKDLTEVLGLIKTKCKIPISSLLSHIVQDWVETNKKEIKKLPTNKYL